MHTIVLPEETYNALTTLAAARAVSPETFISRIIATIEPIEVPSPLPASGTAPTASTPAGWPDVVNAAILDSEIDV